MSDMSEVDVAASAERELPQQDDSLVKVVVHPDGVRYERVPEPEKTGIALVETPRAKTKRDLEMAAGAQRVAALKADMATRPPRIRSEKELRAEGTNTPVFRSNTAYADRVINNNGSPVSQHLGALMRKVGGGVKPAEAPVG